MIKRKLKTCDGCGKERILWSKKLCKSCHAKAGGYKTIQRKKNNNAVFRVAKTVPKATGELEIFKIIWEEREHVCQVCSSTLHVFDVWNMAHILSKKSYPSFRLNKENIWLLCRSCHDKYDNRGVEDKPEFSKLLEEKQRLKELYHLIKK